jgi:hypothetical protein
MSESQKPKSKKYNEHGKEYAPYNDDIIIAHLYGMTDKEMANVLERKVKNIAKQRTKIIRDFLLKNIKSMNYFVWMATKYKLQNDLLIERLDAAGIKVVSVDVPNEAISDEIKRNFNAVKNGEDIKDPKWEV